MMPTVNPLDQNWKYNELFDFERDSTTRSMLFLLSMMTPEQREVAHAFLIDLYRLEYGKTARFLADGTWSAAKHAPDDDILAPNRPQEARIDLRAVKQQTGEQQNLIIAGPMQQRDALFGASEAIRNHPEATNADAQIQNALTNLFSRARDGVLGFLKRATSAIAGSRRA